MKIQLLTTILLAAASIQAQQQYYGQPNDEPVDGLNNRSYTLLSSATPLDQSATGENLNWDFSGLTEIGFSTDIVMAPTEDEFDQYTGTVKVVTKTTNIGPVETSSKLFFYENAVTAFTGAEAQGLILNYSEDNASVGHFPLAYGFSGSDESAGTYSYSTFSGTFDGTISTHVDAYGLLTTDAFGPVSEEVTRVKIVQNLSLNYLIFNDVGTVTQTTYHYFRQADRFPYFTTTELTISIPSFSIEQSITGIEHANPAFLAAPVFTNAEVSISPNPVSDHLVIRSEETVRSAIIYDMTGRTVLRGNNAGSRFDVSGLSAGNYLIRLQTDTGTAIKRFIKK